jgi:hypothetical protein
MKRLVAEIGEAAVHPPSYLQPIASPKGKAKSASGMVPDRRHSAAISANSFLVAQPCATLASAIIEFSSRSPSLAK